MNNFQTLPALLFKHAQERPNDTALRWKRYGRWKVITWSEYANSAKQVALGLEKLGIKKGEVVTFLCRNRPEWIYLELGAMIMGILPFGIFADIEDRQMIYHYLNLSDAKVVLAENQEQADKVLDLREKLPKIKYVVVPEFKEVAHYHDPIFVSFDELLELGKADLEKNSDRIDEAIKKVDPHEPCLLSTTSGTTGLPKMAVLSNQNFIGMAQGINGIDPVKSDQNYVSSLTTAWTGERMMSIAWALVAGFIVNFPESNDTIMRDLREIAPVVLFQPPRMWEGIQASIEIGINDTSPLKRKAYRWLLTYAVKTEEKRLKKQPIPWKDKLFKNLAEVVVLRKVRDYFGLSNVLYVYTGGAALGPDVVLFFRGLGINIKQIFGQSETSGIAFVHRNDDIKLESVGKPLRGIEVDITDIGEIRVRGIPVFLGYYNNQEATSRTLRDGWLYTGDYGYIDEDQHLVVIDRLTEMMKTEDGTSFSPQYLETKFKFSPYIREAVAFGHQKPYIVMLFQIDMQVVGNWAERRNIPYTTFTDLASKPEVYKLIEGEFDRINELIPKQMRPKRFGLLKKQLDPELGEITYTAKIRRDVIMKRHEELFKSLY